MDLWIVMDASAALKADGERHRSIEHHTRKLRNIIANKDATSNKNSTADNKDKATTNDDRKVVNLSNHDLNKEEINILKKGLGFTIAPKTIPVENIVCNIEDNIKNLNEEDKDTIRQDCAMVLRNAKPPKNNINKKDQEAIKNLRNNENIIILRADKGGAIVVMNKIDYNTKMMEHLTTTGSYKNLDNNPISMIIKEVKKAIKVSNLDEWMKKLLT
jgi:hypothetical protein